MLPIHQRDVQVGAEPRANDARTDGQVVDQPKAKAAVPGKIDADLGIRHFSQEATVAHDAAASDVSQVRALGQVPNGVAPQLRGVVQPETAIDVEPGPAHVSQGAHPRKIAIQRLARRNEPAGDHVVVGERYSVSLAGTNPPGITWS